MLEWIGNPRSSIPVFSLYTHVPPTREDCSNTCTSNTSSSLVRCLAAESPAAPAPITHTRRSFRILLLEESFLLKSRAKKQETSWPQWSHSCQAGRQDKANPLFWLAARASKMASLPAAGFPTLVPRPVRKSPLCGSMLFYYILLISLFYFYVS